MPRRSPLEDGEVSRVDEKRWALALTRLATRRPRLVLLLAVAISIVSVSLAAGLELRMNWVDLLPAGDPTVEGYKDILDRFGEGSIVVALEGERDSIVAMAEELGPRLEALESLRAVVGKLPVEFMRNHGFVLLKPDQFDRMLASLGDWTLTGTLTGINADFEREYTESESNLRRDEVDVARSVLGLTRALELLSAGVAGQVGLEAMSEAADAAALGEPWMLSLDRQMLLVVCTPKALWGELDVALATLDEVEGIMYEVGARYPGVHASTTGIVKIGEDEMNSVGSYTILLSLGALIIIYFLLARTFLGWVMPLVALTPLVMGILWTQGLLRILFGGLNIITAMMMLVLLGLGVDFAIHVIARFQEERSRGGDLSEVLVTTLSGTGTAVTVGALTTALAFFTLMVGRTRGIFEFGAAAGTGVILTLVAIFLTLPPLLVLRERRLGRAGGGEASGPAMDSGADERGGPEGQPGPGWSYRSEEAPVVEGSGGGGWAASGYAWIGSLAALGWRRPVPFLSVAALLMVGSVWGLRHTQWEWDFLELEAEGLRSVELQREIPGRFGVSDHAAWVVTASVEESRELKEHFRQLPEVGDVTAISDFLPAPERLATYQPKLEKFRAGPLQAVRAPWQPGDTEILAAEVERLWDNLDLMSNLAFAAGLDRIVRVIDRITGLDAETGDTDDSALLPTLTRRLRGERGEGEGELSAGPDDARVRPLAEAWAARMRDNLEHMTNPAPVSLDQVPENFLRTLTPREGEGFLLQIVPRRYLYDREALERFAEQTEEIRADVISTEKLILVMNDETLADGRSAALLALATIAVLLLVHFRGLLGLLAMLPLALGSLGMLGLMYLLGIKYNYVNLIAVPIILGIGIDDGVHALHRYREEPGEGEVRVMSAFRHVGKAILLTSVTTMIGFGSVAFYEMRGMASFGQVLFMGVGTCFLATVLVLPPLMRVLGVGKGRGVTEAGNSDPRVE